MICFRSFISSLVIFRPSTMNLSYFCLNFLCCRDCMNLIRALDSGSIISCCRQGRRLHFPLWIYLVFTLFLLSSCNSKKYLSEGQSFLFKNTIKIKSDHKVDDAADLKYNLSRYYRQRATRGIIPRHIFYYRYQESLKRRPNRKKWSEERLIRNQPVIYDSVKAELTTEDFEKYLNLRGYRTAQATFKAKTYDNKTYVNYRVDPGPRIYIDTFHIATTDSSLRKIIDAEIDEAYLERGSPLDIELYNQEKTRLVADFQNEGYARFDETYIPPLEVDTAGARIKATMRILNENDSIFHKKYYVGTVTINPDFNLTDTSALYDTLINEILYVTPQPELTLKHEAIERNLFLHQGDLTRKDNFNQTLKNLSRMELIKFVTPSIEVDTMDTDTPFINYTLYLTRNKKIDLSGIAEINYANIISQNPRSLFGTALSGSYRDLNLFKGAEIFRVNGELGVEFNFLNKDEEEVIERNVINSFNAGLGANLSFPRFIDPFGLYHMIGHTHSEEQPAIVGNKLRRWLLYDATTRINTSYNYVDIRELYKYYAITTGLSYDIIPDATHKLTIDRLGFDLFVPTPTDSFRIKVLDKSKFQEESFRKYLFSGLLFRKYSFEQRSEDQKQSLYSTLIHSFELSGLEVWGINLLYNAISNNTKEFVIGKSTPGDVSNLIEFSHFAKAEVDVRYFYNFSSSTQLGFRFNPGYATPFGGFSTQVPYIKQFFVGGALSNRAWQTRQLGPGAYHDINADTTRFAYYQTGDIKIDMSLELRFPLFWYFDGAVFLDAANVWTIKRDESRVNPEDPVNQTTQFQFKDFYKEFGIGYGFGIRLDLDFFIIRLDLGYKLHSPYPLETEPGSGKYSRWYKTRFPSGAEAQIAVGLPFD